MGIFNRNYDYGYRSEGGFRARNGGYGNREGWDHPRGENRLMGDVNRHYDRDSTFQSGRYGAYGAYDRDMGNRGTAWGWGDRDDTMHGYGARGYDRNYKSRWETDYGDPFGDRASGTPIRVMRGEYRGYDRGLGATEGYDRGYGATAGYDRTYMHGVNYDPYYGPRENVREDRPRGTGTWARGWGYEGQDNRY